MEKRKDINNKNHANSQDSELFEDLDSSKESQNFPTKGLEHITQEYRNKLMAFIQDKINSDGFGCSSQLYNFALGLNFNKMLKNTDNK